MTPQNDKEQDRSKVQRWREKQSKSYIQYTNSIACRRYYNKIKNEHLVQTMHHRMWKQDQFLCHSCQTWYSKEITQYMKSNPVPSTGLPLQCHTCLSSVHVVLKQARANALLHSFVCKTNNKQDALTWPPDIVFPTPLYALVENRMLQYSSHTQKLMSTIFSTDCKYKQFKQYCSTEIQRFSVVTLQADKSLDKTMLQGAFMAQHMTIASHRILDPPLGNCLGLLVFVYEHPTTKKPIYDYGSMLRMPIPDHISQQVMQQETAPVKTRATVRRQGSAGGFYIPISAKLPDDPRSLSKATTRERVLIHPWKQNSTRSAVTYLTSDSSIKQFGSIYNDIMGSTVTPTQSRTMAKQHKWYRDLLVHYAHAHLIGLAAFDHIGVLQSTDWDHFFFCLHRAGQKAKEWTTIDSSITLWTSWCLEFMISFSTSNNHQALAAHVDGNAKYPVETMSLFSRFANSPSSAAETGYLYLPQQHAALRLQHSTTMVNLHLNHTLHVADYSRNLTNTTKVQHGAK